MRTWSRAFYAPRTDASWRATTILSHGSASFILPAALHDERILKPLVDRLRARIEKFKAKGTP